MMAQVTMCKMFSKRTFLEKCLSASVFALIVTLITVLILYNRPSKPQQSPSCESDSCKRLGSAVLQYMDVNVNPCTDFYSYVCGGWDKKQQIPSDMWKYSITEVLRGNVQLQIRDLLSSRSDSDSLAVNNARMFYESCMDIDGIEKRGVRPLRKLLRDFGGWPVIHDDWKSRDFDPLDAITKIQLRTAYGFILLSKVAADTRNTSKHILQLDAPTLTILREVLINQNTEFGRAELRHYKKFFLTVARLLGAGTSKSLDAEFQAIVDTETTILEMISPSTQRSDGLIMTVEELNTMANETDWLRYVQLLTNSTLSSISEESVVKTTEEIVVSDKGYYQKISRYISDRTWHRQIAIYLGWRVVMLGFHHLPQAFNDALRNYQNDSGYNIEPPVRWKVCVNAAREDFSNAISFLYVRKHFPEEVKNEILKLAFDIRYQFENTLRTIQWMDNRTKKAALQKLLAMKIYVGHPYWITDEDAVNEKYIKDKMPNMSEDVFENYLALNGQTTQKVILKLRLPNIVDEWPMSPITVNAVYSRNANAIAFPAAFLQEPMYSPFIPRFYNFAAIGAIIGHEMTHGFDSEGRKRNSSGALQNWWSLNSEQEFLNKADCFVDQYNEYVQESGKRTLAENIADNGGLRQTFMEFMRWKIKGQETRGIPGLERFTLEQQFFIIHGSIWCTKYKQEMMNSTVLTDNHSEASFRLKGSIANLPEFFDAFHCDKSAGKKCVIW